ncbi:Saf4/Yju2 protein like protein [Aduncisulcus paluster]|nr:Saf4/Yju2 protein like protein [Aduncisulcus paluster]
MAERKTIQKFIPDHFDASELRRYTRKETLDKKRKGLVSKERITLVTLELPMSMRCTSCGNTIFRNTRFNAKKQRIREESYYRIPVFRFFIKCTCCSAQITFKSDPEHECYVCENGAVPTYSKPIYKSASDEIAIEREEARKVLGKESLLRPPTSDNPSDSSPENNNGELFDIAGKMTKKVPDKEGVDIMDLIRSSREISEQNLRRQKDLQEIFDHTSQRVDSRQLQDMLLESLDESTKKSKEIISDVSLKPNSSETKSVTSPQDKISSHLKKVKRKKHSKKHDKGMGKKDKVITIISSIEHTRDIKDTYHADSSLLETCSNFSIYFSSMEHFVLSLFTSPALSEQSTPDESFLSPPISLLPRFFHPHDYMRILSHSISGIFSLNYDHMNQEIMKGMSRTHNGMFMMLDSSGMRVYVPNDSPKRYEIYHSVLSDIMDTLYRVLFSAIRANIGTTVVVLRDISSSPPLDREESESDGCLFHAFAIDSWSIIKKEAKEVEITDVCDGDKCLHTECGKKDVESEISGRRSHGWDDIAMNIEIIDPRSGILSTFTLRELLHKSVRIECSWHLSDPRIHSRAIDFLIDYSPESIGCMHSSGLNWIADISLSFSACFEKMDKESFLSKYNNDFYFILGSSGISMFSDVRFVVKHDKYHPKEFNDKQIYVTSLSSSNFNIFFIPFEFFFDEGSVSLNVSIWAKLSSHHDYDKISSGVQPESGSGQSLGVLEQICAKMRICPLSIYCSSLLNANPKGFPEEESHFHSDISVRSFSKRINLVYRIRTEEPLRKDEGKEDISQTRLESCCKCC